MFNAINRHGTQIQDSTRPDRGTLSPGRKILLEKGRQQVKIYFPSTTPYNTGDQTLEQNYFRILLNFLLTLSRIHKYIKQMRSLKKTRKAKGFTLRELSEATGLSSAAISRLEQGHTVGKVSTKVRIEQALKERINWLSSEPILENVILSDWIECEMLFRLLVQKINGLVEKNERREFIDTIGRYLRKIKRHDEEAEK